MGDSTELRLLPLGGVAAQPRTIWSPGDGSYASVQDWFPSGDRVAAVVSTSDNTSRIVTVSLDDGDVRQVRSIDWDARPSVRVSPDGRYLAYSRAPSREITEKDIFVVAVDGSSESAIVKHAASDEVVGWSPDGGHLLFNSDRSGQASPPTRLKEKGSGFSGARGMSGMCWRVPQAEYQIVTHITMPPKRASLG